MPHPIPDHVERKAEQAVRRAAGTGAPSSILSAFVELTELRPRATVDHDDGAEARRDAPGPSRDPRRAQGSKRATRRRRAARTWAGPTPAGDRDATRDRAHRCGEGGRRGTRSAARSARRSRSGRGSRATHRRARAPRHDRPIGEPVRRTAEVDRRCRATDSMPRACALPLRSRARSRGHSQRCSRRFLAEPGGPLVGRPVTHLSDAIRPTRGAASRDHGESPIGATAAQVRATMRAQPPRRHFIPPTSSLLAEHARRCYIGGA